MFVPVVGANTTRLHLLASDIAMNHGLSTTYSIGESLSAHTKIKSYVALSVPAP